jgi:hypothetical protein
LPSRVDEDSCAVDSYEVVRVAPQAALLLHSTNGAEKAIVLLVGFDRVRFRVFARGITVLWTFDGAARSQDPAR